MTRVQARRPRQARTPLTIVGASVRAHLIAGAVAAMALAAPDGAAHAQQMDQRTESLRLREAAAMEWRGRLEDARAVLVRLLSEYPTSSGGLFGLERILRNLGELDDVLVFADEYLEADPTASGVRYMKLRVLAELDSMQAFPAEAAAWFEAEPDSPDPYRETARLLERSEGPEAALDVLRQGQSALGGTRLSREIGDQLARMGRNREAVAEWVRVLDDPDTDTRAILLRVRRMQGDSAVADPELADPLVRALGGSGESVERRRTAVLMALEAGLTDRAVSLAEELRGDLSGPEALSFVRELAQQADAAGVPRLSLWALEEERQLVSDRERITVDLQIAGRALQAGDTTTALEAQSRLARSLPQGSVERRRVVADLIRVEAGTAAPETVLERLAAFRTEYPSAPELDELHALTAAGLVERGMSEQARAVLELGRGPLSALERAYMDLMEGDVEAGRRSLEFAVAGLPPVRATQILRLVGTLEELSAEGRPVLGLSAALAHRDRLQEAVDSLVAALPALPDEDRPAAMAWAAESAREAGNATLADELLSAVVTGYPDSRAFPEASLALARLRVEAGDALEARALLEALILDRPGSPVVPAARRELQRLRSAGQS